MEAMRIIINDLIAADKHNSYFLYSVLPDTIHKWETRWGANKITLKNLSDKNISKVILSPFITNEGQNEFLTIINWQADYIKEWVKRECPFVNFSAGVEKLTYGISKISESMTAVTESLKKLDKGEDKDMKGLNIEFGNCEKKAIKMSPYGLAVKNGNNNWVAYDKASGDIIDVDIFNFDCGRYLYRVPVAISDIKTGDVIIHNRYAMFVTEVLENSLKVVDPAAGENREIILTKNMFGFNFATKIISLFDNFGGIAADKDNPFGNMLPFMLMGEGEEFDPMTMFFLMGQKGNMGMSNPLLLLMLCNKDQDKDNMLPFLLMSQNGNLFTNK